VEYEIGSEAVASDKKEIKKVKRITTFAEKQYIIETRKKYQRGELKDRMEKAPEERKRKNDPYGLSEAFWKIFTKPKV
jgi:hypothetical protein|tara:strand:+ start:190 stop:423 length:234 start_codon:yes stop_codon:yes gene_type:complete